MNNRPLDDTIYRTAADTVESLALLTLVPEDEAPAQTAPGRSIARVRFTGAFDGELLLTATGDMLLQLAGNMLGLEDGSTASPEQQEDALKELANVVCGNLLPAIAGPQPVFHMGAPERLTEDQAAQAVGNVHVAGTARMFTDAGSAEITLLTDARCPAAAQA